MGMTERHFGPRNFGTHRTRPIKLASIRIVTLLWSSGGKSSSNLSYVHWARPSTNHYLIIGVSNTFDLLIMWWQGFVGGCVDKTSVGHGAVVAMFPVKEEPTRYRFTAHSSPHAFFWVGFITLHAHYGAKHVFRFLFSDRDLGCNIT